MTMPRVMGKAVEEARNELAQLGLKSEVEYQDSDTVPAGEVMNSSVGTGEEVLTGSTVILTASAGPQGIEVPSVTDMDYEDGCGYVTVSLRRHPRAPGNQYYSHCEPGKGKDLGSHAGGTHRGGRHRSGHRGGA